MDHSKAVIVVVTDKGKETKLIISRVEKQLRCSGDSPLKGRIDKAFLKNNLGGRIAGIETVDKITDSQIAAEVRK
jgi:hypothetical protein